MKNLSNILSIIFLFTFLFTNLDAQINVNNAWGKKYSWEDSNFNTSWGSVIYRNGPIAIGTNNHHGNAMLTVRSRGAQGFSGQAYNYNIVSEIKDNTERAFAVKRDNGITFQIDGDGRTYIGFDRPNTSWKKSKFMLWVDGAITCTKVKVQLTSTDDWADYVFQKDYALMPIDQVAQFIATNKHLPNIPSAQQLVKEEGIELLDITTKQQEKIEELFLYMIQLNEENKALKSRLDLLENK